MIKWSSGQLCDHCNKKVEDKEVLVHRRFHEGVPHYYLFEWGEDSDHFCKRLAYFLKYKAPSYFAEWVTYFGDEIKINAVEDIETMLDKN